MLTAPERTERMESKEKKLTISKAQELMQIKITAQDITKYFCPLATEKEVYMALGIIRSLNLNPFKKEVHLIKYDKNSPISIVIGYEVFIKRAERTKLLNGWEVGISEDGKKAWVKIARKDWVKEFYWEVLLSEFSKNQATWKQIPDFMGKKVAIAQGFRLAFPDECGGLPYTKEEYEAFDIGAEIILSGKPAVDMPQEIKPEAKQAAAEVFDTAEAKQAAAEVFDTAEVKETDKELNVLEALGQPEGAEFDMWGIIFSWKEKTSKKDMEGKVKVFTDYQLSPRDSTQLITIRKFGKAHEGITENDTILFRQVKVSKFNESKTYLANTIEILQKGSS